MCRGKAPAGLSCENVVKRPCIHVVTPNGQIIPFDTCNLFHRNGGIDEIRARRKVEAIA
jgi:tetraether lipid synthase